MDRKKEIPDEKELAEKEASAIEEALEIECLTAKLFGEGGRNERDPDLMSYANANSP